MKVEDRGEASRPKPTAPSLEYVFTIEADIERPRSSGPGLGGERLHIPIIGGIVRGPRLSGTILAGGSDWPLLRADGSSLISASYSVQADDGTLIFVRNDGMRVSGADVTSRLRAGALVDPGDYYFRTAPRFDAPDGPHAWLRESIFVASLAPRPGAITIDVYRVG